jgi:hypothetical protein
VERIEQIDQVILEMGRVWGDEGFGGGPEEYEWLQHHYKITEGRRLG